MISISALSIVPFGMVVPPMTDASPRKLVSGLTSVPSVGVLPSVPALPITATMPHCIEIPVALTVSSSTVRSLIRVVLTLPLAPLVSVLTDVSIGHPVLVITMVATEWLVTGGGVIPNG